MAKKQTAKQDEKPEKSEKAAKAETAPAKEEKPAKKEKEARKAKEPKAKTSPAAPPGESAATAAPAPAPASAPVTTMPHGEAKKRGRQPGNPPALGKKLKNHLVNVQQRLTKEGPLPVKRAIGLLKQLKRAKFDETVEVHMSLGVDMTQNDQMVRGSVPLPHGIGKSVRVVVFCQGDNVARAKEAGAEAILVDPATFPDILATASPAPQVVDRAAYDTAITKTLANVALEGDTFVRPSPDAAAAPFPANVELGLEKIRDLRYGARILFRNKSFATASDEATSAPTARPT